jgi:multidrug efflux system membrane fusion protein
MQDDIRDTRDRQDKPEPRATEPHIGPDHQLPPPSAPGDSHIGLGGHPAPLWPALLVGHAPPPGPGGGRRRQAGRIGGTVTLTTSTAKKGSIGVYLDAIGTVTPVYTTTIISQVTGVISQVLPRRPDWCTAASP